MALPKAEKTNAAYGFTIVELVIVIVIIAILVTIAIIAFSGISQRAIVASLSSDLENSAKQLKLDQVVGSAYPATTAAASGGLGLKASGSTTYQYTVDNGVSPQTFCLSASNGTTAYYITNDGIPTLGVCPGHTAPGGPVEQTVATFAGSTNGITNGTGTAARFGTPNGIAIDSTGLMYVADFGNHTVRKVTSAAVVTTFAGDPYTTGNTNGTGSGATFNNPSDVALDSTGNIYVADGVSSRIRKITPAAVVTTFAGSTSGYLDATGTSAQFNSPNGIAVDSLNNVFVADSSNHRIRKITPAGVVTTFAGSTSGYLDATGTSAQLYAPFNLCIDSADNIYVADRLNNRIRKITPAGVVTTVAGSTSGYVDATGTAARFNLPSDVAVDSSGNLYVADTGNNRIRKITLAGVVTTVAGSTSGYLDGLASVALFNQPKGIGVDSSGALFVVDTSNNRIRKVQ